MNYREYDRIQATLGGVGDAFRSQVNGIISDANTDNSVIELVEQVAFTASKSFDEIALLVSQAMRASIE